MQHGIHSIIILILVAIATSSEMVRLKRHDVCVCVHVRAHISAMHVPRSILFVTIHLKGNAPCLKQHPAAYL